MTRTVNGTGQTLGTEPRWPSSKRDGKTRCSDEEMWRKIHDPVGAERMELTRTLEAQGLTELLSTDYVDRKVAKFARELEEKRRVDSEA